MSPSISAKTLSQLCPYVVNFGHFRKPFGEKENYTVFRFDGGEYFIFLDPGQAVPPEGAKVFALFSAEHQSAFNKKSERIEGHAVPRALVEILKTS